MAPPARRPAERLGCAARFCTRERSLRRRRLAKISGRASPPGPPRPHGDSQEIVAVTSDSVEVGPCNPVSDLLDLDLDVDSGGEVEALERLDGLRCRLHD